MAFSINDPVAIDGPAADFPVAAGFFGFVDLMVPAEAWALLSLYGEAQVNPVGTAQHRVIPGLEWAAQFARADGGAGDFQSYPLTARAGTAGRLSWTYQDGRELARIQVGGPGVFRWGAYGDPAAKPASVTKALVRVRGVLLPKSTPTAELARLLVLWRGGA